MSAKMRKRVRAFGGDLSQLYELIDPAILPEEFGGSSADCGEAWFREELVKEAAELAAAGSVSRAAPPPPPGTVADAP
jgi:hypothetical protein